MIRPHARAARPLAALTVVVCVLALLPTGRAAADPPDADRPTTTNAVSDGFADTFADPAVIRAKNGWWYAYSTADPLRAGDEPGVMHIARTRDWVEWEYRGTVFDETNRPGYAAPTAGLWAPDVRYLDGRYVLYYSVTDTTVDPGGSDSAIGVATAPAPEGPWTPEPAPTVAPRPNGDGGFLATIDPAGFTDVDGQRYLYYGSYGGGLFVTPVGADGLTATGPETRVAASDRYEGAYVVRHDDWYYLMGSAANCCAGPTTGYSVFSGRSRSPLGPFVDADGIGLDEPVVGGTLMLTQNGNRWIGAGHHAIATDAEGRDFVVYHALDRDQPWLTEPFGINRRPMLIDRIDWVDGWPRTRAGAGPSDAPQPAPVTTSGLGIVADDPARQGWRGLRSGPDDPQAGATAQLRGRARTAADAPAERVRLQLDLTSRSPLTVQLGDRGADHLQVTADPRRDRLTLTTVVDGEPETVEQPLADLTDGWESLVVEVDGSRVLTRVSESALSDPHAEVTTERSGLSLAAAPVALSGRDALVDNVTVNGLAEEAEELVDVPEPGPLLTSEEFSSLRLTGATWVRENQRALPRRGALRWPVEDADLVGAGDDAGVLLFEPPTATEDWIAETKVTLDLGEDEIRNFQQAGIVAYRGDDDFARLSTVAIAGTRQTEFGRELVATEDGRTSYGGAIIGTPAPTVHLRLAHSVNGAGEHLFRAGTSRDGEEWTWGATWTFAAGETPRIGLVAHGGDEPAATAAFDYLRFSALR